MTTSVQLGNTAGRTSDGAPAVTSIPDLGDLTFPTTVGSVDVADLFRHLRTHPGQFTQLPDHEAFVLVVRTWDEHSDVPPTWVASSNPELERVLSEFYGCARGVPDNVEDTHWTHNGPPGVGPEEVTP